MKIKEQMKKYREMKDAELASEFLKLRREFTLTSLKVKAGKSTNVSEVKKHRRNIARINSIIKERTYGAAHE